MCIRDRAKTARAAYDRYEFHAVYRAVYNFCVVDMSNFYLDIIKDRLYCGAEAERRSAQTALYHICLLYTSGYQHFFVNGRYVKSRTMTAALEEAYANQKMVGKFPGCVLHLTTRLNAVDVNVHPTNCLLYTSECLGN